jgi:hypothetical protein
MKDFSGISNILTVFAAEKSMISTFFQFFYISKTLNNQANQKKVKKKIQKDLEIKKK